MITMFALFVANTNNISASALRLLTDPSERGAGIPKTIQNKNQIAKQKTVFLNRFPVNSLLTSTLDAFHIC